MIHGARGCLPLALLLALGFVAGPVAVPADAQPALLVEDINPGAAPSSPQDPEWLSGTLLFTADDGILGAELWKSDGTAAGTSLVKDLCAGPCSANPREKATAGGLLFFVADDGAGAVGVWKSDGTEAGTVLLRGGFGSGAAPRELTPLADAVVFASGMSVFRADATGVALVKDLSSTPLVLSGPSQLTAAGGAVFFTATYLTGGSPVPAYQELYRTDGTTAGTVDVGYAGEELTLVGNALFFVRRVFSASLSSETLEKLDPQTNQRTALRETGTRSIGELAGSGSTLFFTSDSDLWKSDGTAAGTVLVEAFTAASGLTDVNHTLFLVADDGVYGPEPWTSDGTAAGTVLVRDVAAGAGGSSPTRLTPNGSEVLFTANDDLHGRQLWASDGTWFGTRLVEEFDPGDVPMIAPGPAGLFFTPSDSSVGYELWLLPAVPVYRLYLGVTLEHLYTTDAYEDRVLGTVGWRREGVAFRVFPNDRAYGGETPIALHRLYNAGVRQHLWTADTNEASVLSSSHGWTCEGVTGYVLATQGPGTVPLYRMALASPPLHLWTTDPHEYQVLSTQHGWIGEGVSGHVLP